MTKAGQTWHDLARNAQNRVRWKKIALQRVDSQF